ncbi:MAG: antitoxin VapB family protein [Thermoplasmataceae archaeon]
MSKTITIRETVYNELVKVKKENESFSELLDRLVKSEDKTQLLKMLRGSVNFTDKNKLIEEIRTKRMERRA